MMTKTFTVCEIQLGEADTALIAAAPDLFEALAELRRASDAMVDAAFNSDGFQDAVLAYNTAEKAADAALAKALGEQP